MVGLAVLVLRLSCSERCLVVNAKAVEPDMAETITMWSCTHVDRSDRA